jgi:hypothetical protein
MRRLHLMNPKERNARVAMASLRAQPAYKLGQPDKEVSFRRYLAAGEGRLHSDMAAKHGEDYSQALIDADPEIDMESVGRRLTRTDSVFLSAKGEVLYAPPRFVEVLLAPDGSEKERREPEDVPSNTDDELPVRWSGKKIEKAQAVRDFVFSRTIQLRHIDGLTYDFMYAMAKELHDEGVLVLLGAGAKGKSPLVMQTNGKPYRGFLEGRVDGKRYALLLHLSNMEMKRPE